MYGKFWELSNGNWTEITQERFDKTLLPAVYWPSYSSEDLIVKNLPNIEISRNYPRTVKKTFPCGRKYAWTEDRYTNMLDLVKESLKFNNFEDIELDRLREKKEQLEKKCNEMIRRLSDLHNELDEKNSKISRMRSGLNELASDLDKAIETNEKGGSGSRKAVRELLAKWIEYKEDEDGYQFPSIKID